MILILEKWKVPFFFILECKRYLIFKGKWYCSSSEVCIYFSRQPRLQSHCLYESVCHYVRGDEKSAITLSR